jgi:cold shock CspA family protein
MTATAAPTGKVVGIVSWFEPALGYGFIQPSAPGDDFYVHEMEVSGVIRAGDVKFQPAANRQGRPRALSVERA